MPVGKNYLCIFLWYIGALWASSVEWSNHRSDKVRSLFIQGYLGLKQLLNHIKKSQLKWFGYRIRMPPFKGFPGTSYSKQTLV